jgi:hypothetical protein
MIRSGCAFPEVPKISKNFVAYMADLVAVSPYKHVLPAESGSVQIRRRNLEDPTGGGTGAGAGGTAGEAETEDGGNASDGSIAQAMGGTLD